MLTPFRTEQIAERERMMAEAQSLVAQASGARPALPDALARLPVLLFEPHWPSLRDLIASVPLDTLGNYRSTLGPIARYQGESEIARTIVRDILPSGPGTEPGTSRFLSAIAMQRLGAALAHRRGRPRYRASAGWRRTTAGWRGAAASSGQAEGQLHLGAVSARGGRFGTAHEQATRALCRCHRPRQPLALLAAHRLLGELDTDAGRYDDAASHLDAALALADACAAPYERALTLLALAALRAAHGRPRTRNASLDEVRAICTPLGAPALARADALACGLPRRRSRRCLPRRPLRARGRGAAPRRRRA